MPKKSKSSSSVTLVKEIVPRSLRPPKYDPNFCVRRKFRYYLNATPGQAQPVTVATLIESFGAICTATNSTAVPVWGWARIHGIEMWGQPYQAGQTTPATVGLIWGYQNSMNAPLFGNNKEVQDTSNSVTYTPYIKATPPRGSNASLWQARLDSTGARRVGSGNVLFSYIGYFNCIIEIDVSVVAYDAGKGVATTSFTITNGTMGAYAYVAFDGTNGYAVPQSVDYFT